MSTPDSFDDLFRAEKDGPMSEDLTEGGSHLLDLVAAVDFLRRGDRHGLTVWDALEEALRWWTAEQASAVAGVSDPELADLVWGDSDPLRSSLTHLLAATDTVATDVAIQQAVRRWAATMSSLYNDGAPWPDPSSRQTLPPIAVADVDGIVNDG